MAVQPEREQANAAAHRYRVVPKMLREVHITFMPSVGNLPDLAQEAVVPGLLPADSLSALLLDGLIPRPNRWVMSAGQDLTPVSIVRENLPLAAGTCDGNGTVKQLRINEWRSASSERR